jgi:hypothetical protein
MVSVLEDLCAFMIISREIILIMGNVSDRSCKTIRTRVICNNFFPEHRAVYEIMWENIAQPYKLQMTRRSMRIACWIIKATSTHSGYVTFTAIQRQQCLHEGLSVLRNKYVAFPVE